jgi:hypothetical protein
MFEIGSSSTTTTGCHDPRAQFEADRVLSVPNAISEQFLGTLLAIVDNGVFVREQVDRLGYRGVETPPLAGRVLSLALRRASFLEWLRKVTGLKDITGVSGTVAETAPSADEALDWHDDLNKPERRLAITVDLSPARYQGGVFEMRRKGDTSPFFSHAHRAAGSLLLFAISPQLEHRLTPVTEGGPRRVFAGWFVAEDRSAR